MHRHRACLRVVRVCAAAAAAFSPIIIGCASGPRIEPTLVPAPLVNALISNAFVRPMRVAPDYSVGALPRGYPPTLIVDARAHVVGGMSTNDQIIAVFADSSRRLAPLFDDVFERNGFTRPPAPRNSGFTGRLEPYEFFCSDSASVAAEQLTGANRDLVRVTYRPFRGPDRCPITPPSPIPEQLEIPSLTAPAGVRVIGGGGGGGTSEVNSRAQVTGSNLVPSTILAHYARQLTAAGWRGKSPAVGDRVAAQYFEATTLKGSVWDGVLMAVGAGDTLDLSLNMERRPHR
jgi:hypothetical protein